jgi:hypothetical protein
LEALQSPRALHHITWLTLTSLPTTTRTSGNIATSSCVCPKTQCSSKQLQSSINVLK